METEFAVEKPAIVVRGMEVAEACSVYVGPPKWSTNWDCQGSYYAEIFKFDDFGFIVEDIEDCERDEQGITTLTDRRIKVFDSANKLLLDASRIVQGLDKQFGASDASARVESVEDEWSVHRVSDHVDDVYRWLQHVLDVLASFHAPA